MGVVVINAQQHIIHHIAGIYTRNNYIVYVHIVKYDYFYLAIYFYLFYLCSKMTRD